MANPAALVLVVVLVIAAVASGQTTWMFGNEECESEVYGMSRWQCVMWIAGVEFEPYASLDSCCEQINNLSPNCRCDALSQIMLDIPGYQRQVCRLIDNCGLTACPTCTI